MLPRPGYLVCRGHLANPKEEVADIYWRILWKALLHLISTPSFSVFPASWEPSQTPWCFWIKRTLPQLCVWSFTHFLGDFPLLCRVLISPLYLDSPCAHSFQHFSCAHVSRSGITSQVHKPEAQGSSLTRPVAETFPSPLPLTPKDPQICPPLTITLVWALSISYLTPLPPSCLAHLYPDGSWNEKETSLLLQLAAVYSFS